MNFEGDTCIHATCARVCICVCKPHDSGKDTGEERAPTRVLRRPSEWPPLTLPPPGADLGPLWLLQPCAEKPRGQGCDNDTEIQTSTTCGREKVTAQLQGRAAKPRARRVVRGPKQSWEGQEGDSRTRVWGPPSFPTRPCVQHRFWCVHFRCRPHTVPFTSAPQCLGPPDTGGHSEEKEMPGLRRFLCGLLAAGLTGSKGRPDCPASPGPGRTVSDQQEMGARCW